MPKNNNSSSSSRKEVRTTHFPKALTAAASCDCTVQPRRRGAVTFAAVRKSYIGSALINGREIGDSVKPLRLDGDWWVCESFAYLVPAVDSIAAHATLRLLRPATFLQSFLHSEPQDNYQGRIVRIGPHRREWMIGTPAERRVIEFTQAEVDADEPPRVCEVRRGKVRTA